jgi:hypothetical protein
LSHNLLLLLLQFSMLSNETTSNWFPQLRQLHLLGYVAVTDADLPALTSLTHLQSLELHLHKPNRGFAGRVTLRGLWNLAEQSKQLAEIHLIKMSCHDGAMQTLLLVPGRLPGVGRICPVTDDSVVVSESNCVLCGCGRVTFELQLSWAVKRVTVSRAA